MEIIKEKTIAFTGNRMLTSPSVTSSTSLKKLICNELYKLLEKDYLNNGITNFISGAAIGFDLLSAIVVLELRRIYPEIKLIVAIPFLGQEARYSSEDKLLYHQIISKADYQIVISQSGYSNQAYHDRNDLLIANSNKLYAYHNGKTRSGTGSTIRKATEQGIEVVNLYDMI
ncbi:MAG: SLOG family protein [Rikenellaceae bacterium]